MSFLVNKRPRTGVVLTNDRKSNDKIYEIILSSLDRVSGSTVTEALFSISPSLANIVSAEIGSFSFYNLIPNMLSTSNILGFDPTAVYVAVDVTFTPGNWVAPVGLLTVGTFNVDTSLGINDIRYEIYRQVAVANAGLITEILVDPITGYLSFTFDAAAVGVALTLTTTAQTWSGLTSGTVYAGTAWTGATRMNMAIPLSMGLASPEFSNHSVSKGSDFKSTTWMTVIPITTSWGSLQYFEPMNPQQFRFTGSQILNTMTVQLKNSETGLAMSGFESNDKWELMLRVRVSENM